ncbi:hypothetical protein [Bifidobacterium vansinderenii]|uniref:Uncharacterized protein n=1 Tax=Bifidobacterium vansinderenii TaxID=1984871 RepID=A0A229W184_9BIFI|nr:hypothetical protein [Bifidobacterium vansinderenii]OXN01622.1 hypothetical protein Tam10B_0064 [Bifidobacterium vansinderenii]
MTLFGQKGIGGDFLLTRDPDRESPGSPYQFSLAVFGSRRSEYLRLDALTKGDLLYMRRAIDRMLKESRKEE